MKQRELFEIISKEIGKLIISYEYKITHRLSSKFFTRKSTLGFYFTICMLLNFFRKTSSVEVFNFFREILDKIEIVSRQAFEQSRAKISYTAFSTLFEKTVENAMSVTDAIMYCGFRVLAIDGTTLKLENNDELKKEFGETTPVKGQIFARVSMLVDVLNKFIVSANIGKYHIGEHSMALEHIKELSSFDLKKCIITLDRGYWSPEIISSMIDNNFKFLLRISSVACKGITFSNRNSGYYELKYNQKTYKLRFYKFVLSSGETEILVTNIGYRIMSNKSLEKLYHLRWGIETKYNELKSSLQIENISGVSVLNVKQDFYATLFLSNMIAFAKFQADIIIHEERAESNNKYEYNLNINITVGIFKDRFIRAIIQKNPLIQALMLKNIISDISKYCTPKKPNRHMPRNPNHSKPHKSITRKSAL